MIKKKLLFIFPVILLFSFFVKADVPPDKGKKRVKIDLVTETTEDLSDYRFFLDFYGYLREVQVKSKGRTEIPPAGGGARYASGTFLAIPVTSISSLPENPSKGQLENLSFVLGKRGVEGVVELARHRFSMDIPEGKKPPEVVYQIKREENRLKAEQVKNENPENNSSQLVSPENRAGYIVGGVLITLAVLFGGIFAFRKVAGKV